MPLLDMPLHELREYCGRNERPENFDEFWSNAMDEMHAGKSVPDLCEADFTCSFAKCYDFWFNGVGGARIHSKFIRPNNVKTPMPAIITFHGLTGSSGDWFQLLPYAAAGFIVAALDCRGQGGLSEDSGRYKGYTYHGYITRGLEGGAASLYYRSIFLDAAQLAESVMDIDGVDRNRVAAVGLSQGGGLVLACAGLVPAISRAIPIYPFLCDYRRVWEMDKAQGPYKDIMDHFVRFDPRHEKEDVFFTALGYIDCQHFASRIEAEVMMGVGLMDDICPPSTQFAAFNKMRCKKQMKIYHDFGHQKLPEFDDISFAWLCGLQN